MKIPSAVIGEVCLNKDYSHSAKFSVRLDSGAVLDGVTHLSPYAGPQAGVVMIPENGAKVFCLKIGEFWYSIGCLPPRLGKTLVDDGDRLILPEVIDKEKIYTRGDKRDKPQKLLIKTPKGNKLVLSDTYAPDGPDKGFAVYCLLQSHLNKRIMLHDSPDVDSISIMTQHNDGITIMGNKDGEINGKPRRGIQYISNGRQEIRSNFGGIKVHVKNGRELNILNTSKGDKAPSILTGMQNLYGNVNIHSASRDINITGQGSDSRIFLNALGDNGHVEIDSAGTITVYGTGTISIKSGSNLQVQSDGDIDLRAGGQINISADGGPINLKAAGNVNIDGNQTYLQSAQAESSQINVSETKNYYGH